MITILQGPLRSDGKDGWEVRSKRVSFRPPQIVVGMSIGYPGERSYTDACPIIPVILDTGLNQGFSISEHHLDGSAGVDKWFLHKDKKASDRTYLGRRYDMYWATLWLHRIPYRPNDPHPPSKRPILLGKSDKIRVFTNPTSDASFHEEDEVYPRLPLLGLKALTDNQLRLFVDGERSRFRISRSMLSWISADDGLGRRPG